MFQPHEVNSPIRWNDYLKAIENVYKEKYLPTTREESEVLIYDWSDYTQAEIVVEDIERIDFEKNMNDVHSPKFSQWKEKNTREWLEVRNE